MGNSKGQCTVSQKIAQNTCHIIAVFYKLNFSLHIGCTSADIRFHCLFKSSETCLGIVETGNGFMQCVGRKICKHFLKMTKSYRTFIKVFRTTEFFQSIGIFNKMISSPVFPVTVNKVRLSCFCVHKIQSLPLRIPALCQNLLLQIVGYIKYIFHKGNRVSKYGPVHMLKRVVADDAILLKFYHIGIVNMSMTAWLTAYIASFDGKTGDSFLSASS